MPWQVSLPGTFKAADRFVRLSYLVDALPKNLTTYHDMLAAQLGVIRCVGGWMMCWCVV
jgi:penicillin V acylase-like amidase (Ntn superfamily)